MKTRSKSRNTKSLKQGSSDTSEDSQDYASTIISPDHDLQDSKNNKKRFRKHNDQVKILIQELNSNPF